MSGLSVMDRARIEWAVRRVDLELDGRVPWRKRKQIRDELRANLREAAVDGGAREAVRRLGNLHRLAVSYLDVYRGRLDFQAGSWLAVAAYSAIQVLSLAIWIAFTSGVMAGGGHSATYSWWSGLGPFAGGVAGNSFTFVFFSPAHALLMAVAFALGSTHRLLMRR